ncbi:MAG: amino acid ABC transporter permease [Candidatus Heimdallarchaeota archaeon]
MSFWEIFLPEILDGWVLSIKLLVPTIPLGVLLAIALAVARVYGPKPLVLFAAGVVGLIRGLPLVVTLFIIFFALPKLGILFPSFWSAVLGFILCTGAYQSEYVRGAIQSIDVGQSLAAQSVGMRKGREVMNIILPQALRRALPGISNEIIYLILYSSLAGYIGVYEIFAVSRHFNSLHFRPIQIFLTAGLIYAAMATIAAVVFRLIENKFRIPGFEIVR